MSIALFLHVGYLVAWDDYGVAFGWGVPPFPRKHGSPMFRVYFEHPFAWWLQPGKVRQWFYVRALIRKQAKYEKRARADG